MNKAERSIGFIAAIITIFIFFTGIQSLKHFNVKDEAQMSNTQAIKSVNSQKELVIKNIDPIPVTLVKAVLIVPAIVVAFYVGMFAIIIDLVLMFFGFTFPCVTYIWHTVLWNQLIMTWLWAYAGSVGAFLACIITPIFLLVTIVFIYALFNG